MLGHYLLWFVVALSAACSAGAETALTVHNAWIREAPPTAAALAGYMVIENHGVAPRKLIGAESPSFGSIELHRSFVEKGVARMTPQKAVSIPPAGGQVEFKPNGYHLMMLEPAKPLRAGDQVKVTLKFSGDERVITTMAVRNAGGSSGHQHQHGE
ncbi:MAG: copper chaperone PCu(A)C [Gammaproteobacteria bacterium]